MIEYPIVPQNQADIPAFLNEYLYRVASSIHLLAAGHLDKSHVAPAKPRDGDIRYADGTDWDPGSGAGIYYFNGSAWVKL